MAEVVAGRAIASPAAGDRVGRDGPDGSREVDAATPWLLDDATAAWEVLEGGVDLFGLPGGSNDRRLHLRSCAAGDVIGGNLCGSTGLVLALAVPGTVVAPRPGSLAPPLSGPHGEPIDAWLTDLLAARGDAEAGRLRALAGHDRHAVDSANDQVAGVVRASATMIVHDDQAVVAVAALATAEGLRLPESWPTGLPEDLFERVQELCRSVQARPRRVRLEPDWWSRSGYGFITTDGEGRVVAALPRADGVRARLRGQSPYRVVRQGATTPQPLGRQEAQALSLDAVSLQSTLPAQPQRARSLLRLARTGVRGEVVWLSALATASSLMALLVPITLAKVVSSAVPNRQEAAVIGLVVALLAAAFAAFVFEAVRGLTLVRLGSVFDRAVLPALWDRLLRLPTAFHRQYDVGDLANRLLGIDLVRQTIPAMLMTGLLSLTTLLTAGALMIVLSVQLAVPSLTMLLVFCIGTFVFVRSARKYRKTELRLTSRRQAMSLQLVKGIAKIRVAGASATMFARWADLLASSTRARQGAELRGGVIAMFAGAITAMSMAAAYGAAALVGAELSVSVFAAFASAVGIASASAAALALVAGEVDQSIELVARAEPILGATTEDVRTGVRVQLGGAVTFQDLRFAYDGQDTPVLDGFSLDIAAGSFTALVGESGCGKSTVLRCLMGFEQMQHGAVLLDDHDLGELDLTSVRRQFGVVLQRFTLLGGTIYENIVGPRALTEDEAWAAAEQVGLADFIRSLPMGMRTLIVEGGGTFSGGQAQRLMLARAVVGNPRIVVLDEATSALDNPAQELVSQSLARMQCTRIVVAHRLSTVRDADQIAVMEAGRIVELGQHDALMARNGRYADLVRRQL